MDNEMPQQNSLNSGNPEPTNQPTPPSHPSFGGMKVIEPLSPNIEPENPTPQPPAQPVSASPVSNYPQGEATSSTQSTDASRPPQPVASPSSIYPEATRGRSTTNYQIPSPSDNKKAASELYNFNSGYSIGGSIFWNQLIAGIVFGAIFYGITVSVLKTASTSLVSMVGLFHYVIEYLVLIYVPYRVLQSNIEEKPLWQTLLGVAAQSVIVATALELVSLIIIRAVINHGVSSSLTHIGGAGLGVLAIFVYVGFFIVSYFLTKLSWGVAFSLFGKIKNKMVVKAIGIGVVAIIIGGIGYHYSTLYDSKTSIGMSSASSACQSNGLCNYKISGTTKYSVDFYKGARVVGGVVDYEPTNTGHGVHVGVGTAANPNASCSTAETDSTFDIQVQGVSGIVCVFDNTASNLISYTSYVHVNGNNYVINMISYAYQQNLETVKTILNSVVID